MRESKPRPLDRRLIQRTRFEQAPDDFITRQNTEEFASLLRQTPEYRRAVNAGKAMAIPEERSPVLKRLREPAVEAWLILELRWDVKVSEPGAYSSICLFLLDSGEVLCVLRARDQATMMTRRLQAETFAELFLRAWVRRDSLLASYVPRQMNEELHQAYTRLFREHVVPGQYLADAGLCRELLALLR